LFKLTHTYCDDLSNSFRSYASPLSYDNLRLISSQDDRKVFCKSLPWLAIISIIIINTSGKGPKPLTCQYKV